MKLLQHQRAKLEEFVVQYAGDLYGLGDDPAAADKALEDLQAYVERILDEQRHTLISRVQEEAERNKRRTNVLIKMAEKHEQYSPEWRRLAAKESSHRTVANELLQLVRELKS